MSDQSNPFAPPTAPAAETQPTTVAMVRDPSQHPLPHSADVAPSEVDNYRIGGFVTLDEATWPGVDKQKPLPFG